MRKMLLCHLHQSLRKAENARHGGKGELQAHTGRGIGIVQQDQRQRRGERRDQVVLPLHQGSDQQQRLHYARPDGGGVRPGHQHKAPDQSQGQEGTQPTAAQEHLEKANQKGDVHPRDRHHMHQPRPAHGQFLLRILIQLRLIAQEQGAHESRCVPGKEFPHKADQMMVQLRRPEARAFFPHAEAHLSFCRGQQVDVPRCIGPVALAVFAVGAGKLHLRLQPLSRLGAAERAAVVIEECMQFREAFGTHPDLRPDIAAVILGIAQQLGTDRPGLSVQELCRKRGDAGVKRKAAQAHGTP